MNLPLLEAHPTCTLCPLSTNEGVKSIGLATYLLPDSLPPAQGVPAVIFIGQNPGYEENDANEPFVGKSGVLLRGAYIDGISLRTRASVYLTNAVRCWTLNDKKPHFTKNVKPCFPYTIADLTQILLTHSPSLCILICCGSVAVESVWKLLGTQKGMSLSSAFKRNCQTILLNDHPLHIISTFHPSYIAREGGENYIFAVQNHLQLVSSLLSGTLATPSRPFIKEPHPP